MNVPPAILDVIAALFLMIHLWCVNISAAAPLIGILVGWNAHRFDNALLASWSRRLGIQAIMMLFAGALAGLALAAVMWISGDQGLFEVLPSFAYKIKWGIAELVFFLACMAGYLILSAPSMLRHSARRWARGVLAVVASTNLLYHFPPLFIVMAKAANDPTSISSAVGPSEFREWLVRGHVVSLTIHFGLASIAVGSMVVVDRLARFSSDPHDQPFVIRTQRMLAALALVATAAQVLVGLWVLLSLGPLIQNRLMGGDVIAAGCLAASIVATFALLHRLAQATFDEVSAPYARRTLYVMLSIVMLMTITLRRTDAAPPTTLPASGAMHDEVSDV